MKIIRSLKGFRPLTFLKDQILLSKGYKIFCSNLDCTELELIGQVPGSSIKQIASSSRLIARAFRLGITRACKISNDLCLVAERGKIWSVNTDTKTLKEEIPLRMKSPPLSMASIQDLQGFDDGIYFGEYGGNPRKEPVHIWKRALEGEWTIAYTFDKGEINHIHNVIPDYQRGIVWILTGDFDNAAGIWIAKDNFSKVEPLLRGEQEYRCCWLAFFGERILYATDSQLVPNSFKEIFFQKPLQINASDPPRVIPRKVKDIAGSSIYSCLFKDVILTSTTVEPGPPTGNCFYDLIDRKPGPGIKDEYATLIIGNLNRGFEEIGTWRKDKLPFRIFGFGSVEFPDGENPGKYIYGYFKGLKDVDDHLLVFSLNS